MQFTNNHNLPQALMDAIVNHQYDGPSSSNVDEMLEVISASTIPMPPKIRVLTARHYDELVEDVSDNIWRLLGDSVHHVLERADAPHRHVEERFEKELLVGDSHITVSGKVDLYDEVAQQLDDYKVTSVWTVVYSPEGKPEWHAQGNINAWLLRQNGLPVDSIRNVLILRDWKNTEAMKSGDYPNCAAKVIDCPMLDDSHIEAYMVDRIAAHNSALMCPDDDIPECTPDERWQKDDTWAVFKNDNKRATKVFTDEDAANAFVTEQAATGYDKWRVEHRPGECVRCTRYCAVRQFCHFGRTLEG